MFSQTDLLQIQSKGITIDNVKIQIQSFVKGFPYLDVVKPASYKDGIITLNEDDVKRYAASYNLNKKKRTIGKFVPASGAATRMFKSLYEYLANPDSVIAEVEKFVSNIESFAFYNDLQILFSENKKDFNSITPTELIDLTLSKAGLNYGNLPKGLIKFHSYSGIGRVPIEEHLVEGALYACNENNEVTIHFTLSPEHIVAFNELINSKIAYYEEIYKVKYIVSYSIQKPSTDTIAVDNQNKPFREQNGSLIFRPGGHGALLENLNDLPQDIIFIKNIDNVVPDRLKSKTVDYKNALAGLLLETQQKISEYLNFLESDDFSVVQKYLEIKEFIESSLGYVFPDRFLNLTLEDKKQMLYHTLNRPLRVCGMVKNSGEPGGELFWVKGDDGSLSLQILESSQFNLDEEDQRDIFKKATHFNPVDLVIYTKDYKGNKFNLLKYTDPETGFISIKSKDGKELKALELPGLWNGAMAKWNTLFVEVPLITFNPVKTITDLLRPEHQG